MAGVLIGQRFTRLSWNFVSTAQFLQMLGPVPKLASVSTKLVTETGRGIVVIIPVFDDWESVEQVVEQVLSSPDLPSPPKVVLVDDGSYQGPTSSFVRKFGRALTVLQLSANFGHQRAISIGLKYVYQNEPDTNLFVVMDADGEDNPLHIRALVGDLDGIGAPAGRVATRRKRKEKWGFRLFYSLYRLVFTAFVGKRINFGNFSALNRQAVGRLLSTTTLGTHFGASLLKSKIPIARVPLERGRRIRGGSKMNFLSLVSHGLAAMAVFSEQIFARLLVFFSTVLILLAIAGLSLLVFRFWTDIPIPGWTSTLGAIVLVAFLQSLGFGALLTFVFLSRPLGPPWILGTEFSTEPVRVLGSGS